MILEFNENCKVNYNPEKSTGVKIGAFLPNKDNDHLLGLLNFEDTSIAGAVSLGNTVLEFSEFIDILVQYGIDIMEEDMSILEKFNIIKTGEATRYILEGFDKLNKRRVQLLLSNFAAGRKKEHYPMANVKEYKLRMPKEVFDILSEECRAMHMPTDVFITESILKGLEIKEDMIADLLVRKENELIGILEDRKVLKYNDCVVPFHAYKLDNDFKRDKLVTLYNKDYAKVAEIKIDLLKI